jgi:hypothetical protein
MRQTLKNLLARLRAWMAENRRANQNTKAAPCCSAPANVYAAAHRGKGRHG